MSKSDISDTIVALSTPPGMGAIGVIRLSGTDAVAIVNKLFKGKNLLQQPTHTIHLGKMAYNNEVLDEVLISLFIAPHSYTKENVVEISCHGSPYIQQKIMEALLYSGARAAQPGEFTMRAFLNGRFDLSQAEAVADIIASDSQASHKIALQQMRGGISTKLKELRADLVDFTALIELELDFGEEDVEFADRTKLFELLYQIQEEIRLLQQSFRYGNAIKNGIPVAIIGKPNAGKSTLLNALLNEERAIVSPIAGTTRDTIEETITIDGYLFRFIDTAGIREAGDEIERMGIQRSMEKIAQANIVIHVLDYQQANQYEDVLALEASIRLKNPTIKIITVINKIDLSGNRDEFPKRETDIAISAREHYHLDTLKKELVDYVNSLKQDNQDVIITNIRHVEALDNAHQAIERVIERLQQQIPTDLISQDIKTALRHLGNITGEIDIDKDILATIFGKFCIGK
jgi:tRNA modification GTPase